MRALNQPRGPSLTRTGRFRFTPIRLIMRSDTIKRGIERAPHRSLLRATGQVKDGAKPKFAIFMLPVGLSTGNWHFLTPQGDLSHFALYGRNILEIDEHISAVPEPATLLLLGTGLTFAARRRRAKSPRVRNRAKRLSLLRDD